MSNVVIQEDFVLPSLGKIYPTPFDPHVRLRSMTVAEEMKRLTYSEYPYKVMAEIIEACLETKLPISVYDMCLGDYQYLLHKLRTVTYNSNYKMSVTCQKCYNAFDADIDLDDLEIFKYDDSLLSLTTMVLPVTGDTIEIKYQTPRDLDEIGERRKELKKEFPDQEDDPTLMLNMETLIKTVNGKRMDLRSLREYIKKLPLRDSGVILSSANKLISKVGVDTAVLVKCPDCGSDVHTTFRFTDEFFRPKDNI